jgi:glucose/arabinose dehydrogenase
MRIGLVAALALLLCACGTKEEEGATNKQAAAAAVATLGDESVAAVKESQGVPVARLRFLIESRPVVGKPFNVKVTLAGDQHVPQLLVRPESTALVATPERVMVSLGHAGDTGSEFTAVQVFSLIANQEGLVELAVHLTVDGEANGALYLIPILVAKAG